MKITLQFDWSNHQHTFWQVIRTTDHYNDVEIIFCDLCNRAANQSDIPINKHFKHPKGCKCYWCVYCNCPKLQEREKQRTAVIEYKPEPHTDVNPNENICCDIGDDD